MNSPNLNSPGNQPPEFAHLPPPPIEAQSTTEMPPAQTTPENNSEDQITGKFALSGIQAAIKEDEPTRQQRITRAVIDHAVPVGDILSLSRKERRKAIKTSRSVEKVLKQSYKASALQDTFRPLPDPHEEAQRIETLRESNMRRKDKKAALRGHKDIITAEQKADMYRRQLKNKAGESKAT